MNRYLLICVAVLSVLLGVTIPTYAQGYNQVYDNQTRGDIVLTGNVLVRPTSLTAIDNNNQNAAKVDIDTDATTDNSSSAVLQIPAGSQVLWAKLYWESRTTAIIAGPQTIKLSTNGTASGYQSVTSTNFIPVTNAASGNNGDLYSASADVTNIIRNIGSFPANILAGGARVDVVNSGNGSYAGWGLVVAYANLNDPIRQLRVFDGFSAVTNGVPVTSSIAGFRTPDAGIFTVKLGVIAFEGDRSIEGDRLELSKDAVTYSALSNSTNPANNFFNSTISQDGVSFSDTDLNPVLRDPGGTTGGFSNNDNSIGLDIDRFVLNGPGTFFNNNQTSTNLRFSTSGDAYQVTTFTTSIPTAEIVGRVFDDKNFGGGIGRAYNAGAGMAGVPGARVELYSSSGAFIRASTTDTNGIYSFSNLGSAASTTDYIVRVVNSSVVSSRGTTITGLVPVQTYRTEAKSNINPATGSALAQPITNRVGGENSAISDAAAVTTVGAALPANSQSVTTVQLGTDPVVNVDFGYNFDTIVNVNDAGQGSLRQFVLNSNALSNTGLDQVANAVFDPAAGVETSIFQIPNAALTSGVARIALASGLSINGANAGATSIDGRTQTANIGDTNTGTLGSGGTVGVGNIQLLTVPKPEVEINGPNSIAIGLSVQAASAIVRNVSMWGFGTLGDVDSNATILIGSNTAFAAPTITQVVLGASAISTNNVPVSPTAYGKGDLIRVTGISGGSLTNSLLGFAGGKGVNLNASNNWTIQGNEIRNNARDRDNWDAIDARSSGTQILENLVYNHGGNGFDSFNSPGNAVIRNNTVRDNGLLDTPTAGESPGMRVYGTGNVLTQNIFSNNYGAGIMLVPTATALISQNSIFGNGDVASTTSATPSRQLGIDLLGLTDGTARGTSPFVTPNSSGAKGAGGNGLLNFPVFTAQTVTGGNLTLEGFAPAGATVEVFVAAPDPSGFGEGQTYSFNFVEGSAADTDTTTGDYNAASLVAIGYPASAATLTGSEFGARRFRVTVPANGLTSTSALTATATLSNQTSEFSPVTVTFVPPPANEISGTVYLDVNRNGTLDANESGTGLNNLFVKAVLNGQTVASQAVAVDATTGAFQITGLAQTNYTLVLDDNAILADTTPAIPAGYVGTQAPNGTRQITVGNQALLNQNFGLFNGAQISGNVYEDTGAGTGPGIPNVKLNLTQNDGTIVDTTTTDASGNFSFRVPNSLASTPLRVVEFNPAEYRSVSGNVGNTNGTYDLPTDTISFAYVAGATYTGLRFGESRGITFTGEDSKTGTIGSSVFYPHVFTAQTTGNVTFDTTQNTSPNNAAWTVVTYRDTNNNGTLDGGDAQITGPVAVTAGTPITVFLQNFIPTTASNGAQDKLTITANFTPTTGPAQSISRSDLTTVAANQGLVLSKTVDRATAQSGDILLYTITYRNTGADALTNLIVRDATPSYTRFVSAADGTRPADLTGVTIANPAVNSKGNVSWTFAGSLNPGQSGTVTFRVQVE